MKQRIFSMFLVAVMVFTSVDITAFAQEQNGVIVEETITEDEDIQKEEERAEDGTITATEEVVEATEEPTVEPTETPVEEPSEELTSEQTEEPVVEETVEPSEEPSFMPNEEPSVEPTAEVTAPSEEDMEEAEVNASIMSEEIEDMGLDTATTIIDSGKCGDNLTWLIDDEKVLTISGKGDMRDYELVYNSKEYSYYSTAPWIEYGTLIDTLIIENGVKTIGESAFFDCSSLTKIKISASVSNIGAYAFNGCSGLIEIDIPENVQTIGSSAFSGCSGLTEIEIPSNVNVIDHGTFSGCRALNKVVIGEGVRSIGRRAFGNCSELTEIVIPKNVTTIVEYAFEDCNKLKNVVLSEGVNSIGDYAFDGCSVLWEVVIPKSVTSIGKRAFRYPCEIVITCNPEEVEGFEEIRDLVKKIVFIEGTKEIPDAVFFDCRDLKEVIIPKSVVRIGNSAFYGCSGLTEIEIPEGVSDIGAYAFGYCRSLTEIEIPESVSDIGAFAFESCQSVRKVKLSRCLISIGESAFSDCNKLEEINIPHSLSDVGNAVFSGCENLNNIIFEEGETRIVPYLFYGADCLKEIILPDTITDIGRSSFEGCTGLKQIIFSRDLKRIEANAFWGCTSLEKVKLPSGVEMGGNVFENCVRLTKVDMSGITKVEAGTFKNCSLLSNVTVSEGLISIANEAFYNCESLVEIQLPKSIVEIGESAFYNCDKLHNVDMQEGIVAIGNKAFNDCDALVEIQLSKSIVEIGESVFDNCDKLSKITLGDKLTTIGNKAFYNCDNLAQIEIPNSVTSIGEYAFYHCDSLKEVLLGNGIEIIEDYTFAYCTGLEFIEIPYYVKTVKSGVFTGCDNLVSVTLPRKLTYMADDVFSNVVFITIYGIAGTYAETYANDKRIRFVNKENNIESIMLNASKLMVGVNKEKRLLAKIQPINFTDEILWQSDDEEIAEVDEKGTVRGLKQGTTTIRVTNGMVTASCEVIVVKSVSSICLSGLSMMELGERKRIGVTVYPADAYNKDIVWKSSDNSIVSVSDTGEVIALRSGTAIIYAYAVDDSTVNSQITINVKEPYEVKNIEDFQSAHPYENNFNRSWVYTDREKNILKITFSQETFVEDGIDYLLIYNGETNCIGRYTGNELAGKTVIIEGNTVRIKLETNDNITNYGFSIEKIEGVSEEEIGEVLIEDFPEDGIIPNGMWIAGIDKEYTYTGKLIKPEFRVYDHTKLLNEKTDYTISYKNNIIPNNASKVKTAPTITVTGKGNYKGTETVTFKILKKNIEDTDIIASDITVAYNKKVQKKVPTVKRGSTSLKKDTDFTVSYPDLEYDSKAYKAPGTYTILIEGKGVYTGTREVKLTITESKLMSKVTVSKIATQPYTGMAVTTATMTKAPTVKYGDKTKLKEGIHYTVSYENNVKIGTATMTLTGTDKETPEGTFTGAKKVTFKISGTSLAKAKVTGVPTSMTYTGFEINERTEEWGNPIKVVLNGDELTRAADADSEGDYIVTFSKNTNKGTATVTIKGINAYSSSIKKEFVINAYNINDNTGKNLVTEEMEIDTIYAKGGSKPEPVVKFGDTILVKGKDYTLTYTNNTKWNDGTSTSKRPTVTITGKGNFKGTVKIPYTIAKQDIGNMKISVSDVVYKKEKDAYKVTPVIKDLDNKTLKNKTDYTVTSYTYGQDVTLKNGVERKEGETVGKNDIVPAGTLLKVVVTGKGNYKNDTPLVAEYRVVKSSIAKATVTVTSQPYTGKSITIEDKTKIKVKVGKTKLDPEDFEIVDGSFKNNTKVGTASFTIRGVGNYGGTKKVTFKIKPKGLIWWWR